MIMRALTHLSSLKPLKDFHNVDRISVGSPLLERMITTKE